MWAASSAASKAGSWVDVLGTLMAGLWVALSADLLADPKAALWVDSLVASRAAHWAVLSDAPSADALVGALVASLGFSKADP